MVLILRLSRFSRLNSCFGIGQSKNAAGLCVHFYALLLADEAEHCGARRCRVSETGAALRGTLLFNAGD